MTTAKSSDEIVEEHFPLYGPYDPDTTVLATWLLAEVTRYLNYATGSGAEQALPYPAAVYETLGALRTAAERLPQLAEQLATRMQQFAGHPRLRADAGDHDQAVALAEQASAALLTVAAAGHDLTERLSAAQNHVSSLSLTPEPSGPGAEEVHFVADTAGGTACGVEPLDVTRTNDRDAVTCPRCRAAIARPNGGTDG